MASSLSPTPSIAPYWARTLLAAVCTRYHVRQPTLRWHTTHANANAVWFKIGSYSETSNSLTIYACADHLEERMTLLHELAHHIAYCRTLKVDHSELFWRYCWTLYRNYGIPLHVAVLSEFAYMARAEKVLHAMGIHLSPLATLAATYGRAMRGDAWLDERARRLQARLTRISSAKARANLRANLRSLRASQATSQALRRRSSVAYKRTSRTY